MLGQGHFSVILPTEIRSMRLLPHRSLVLAGGWLPSVIVATTLVVACARIGATPICRWVDSDGRSQLSEMVPEQYRKGATCTDSMQYELAPGEAHTGVVQDVARPLAPLPAVAPVPLQAASHPVAKRPAEVVTDATDCPTHWRLYDASMACFGPFRTTRGATRVEAFDVCNVVASPELRCGPRRD